MRQTFAPEFDGGTGVYVSLRKAGALRNGSERGNGTIFHAVEVGTPRPIDLFASNGLPALCGQQPRIMWDIPERDARDEVSCPRCLKILAALAA